MGAGDDQITPLAAQPCISHIQHREFNLTQVCCFVFNWHEGLRGFYEIQFNTQFLFQCQKISTFRPYRLVQKYDKSTIFVFFSL